MCTVSFIWLQIAFGIGESTSGTSLLVVAAYLVATSLPVLALTAFFALSQFNKSIMALLVALLLFVPLLLPPNFAIPCHDEMAQ